MLVCPRRLNPREEITLENVLLVLLAVAPPTAFLILVLRFDRIEPEPPGFIVRLLFLGCLSVIPAALIETLLLGIPLFQIQGIAGSALQSFLVIAPVEEAVILTTVMLFTWRNPNFNERNDGIVYAGTVSVGFAMAENLGYVLGHGFTVGFARAVTSIPGHTFTGVLMGYFVGQAKFAPSRKARNAGIAKGFLVAWFLHGAYDTFALSGTALALLVVPLVAVHFILGFRYLRKGRDLSRARWSSSEPPPPPPAVTASARRWRRIVGRTLLAVCGGFWLLLLIGALQQQESPPTDLAYAALGGVMLTAVPITVGILLERSCRRRSYSPPR